MRRQTVLVLLLLAGLAGLVWFSSHLAALRIYQVDECQNLYMAGVLAGHHTSEFFSNASLFLLGPLSWISRNCPRSADAFQMARLVFLGVFWLNLFLVALAAAGKLYSIRALVALVAVGTLAPIWDYGFEVRHDSLVLTGVLLTWLLIRLKPLSIVSYLCVGAIAVTSLFVAVKSVVYVLPLSLALLAFPPPTLALPRWRLGLAWIIGAALATGLIRLAYGDSGGWQIYLSVFHGVAKYSAGGGGGSSGFAPWSALGRLLIQTPLLLGMVLAGTYAIGVDLVRRGKSALGWSGFLPEFLLLLGSLVALGINPTPYPYNLLHVVPYAFIFVFRYGVPLWHEVWALTPIRPFIVGVGLFAHLIPFMTATRRHLDHFNWRQEQLMTLAEDLTQPSIDPVYDGIGMVPTRPAVNFQWYLHGLNIQSFLDGSGPSVREILAARPAPVLIPSYRTDWLSDADHNFFAERYVQLADDFWVLGKTLPPGGGSFEIYYPGRYRISTGKGSDLAGTYALGIKGLMTPEDPGTLSNTTLDGQPFCNHPVQLSKGVHRIECPLDCQPAVVWMGPQLDRVHRIGPGDHRALFINWY